MLKLWSKPKPPPANEPHIVSVNDLERVDKIVSQLKAVIQNLENFDEEEKECSKHQLHELPRLWLEKIREQLLPPK